ncbi:P-loop containing nucleoside triphosphate hydrolase protein [Nadsonia fulvescens var. elongata DSM 6958]|uniref:p-loop containing nucleoside triphosphate hydrolase protein n=1 Tax=Nadsonia fulvescens var. elongata DSM 6958 TaxID=857566 RepID=A0A1E3PE56_9ASCO|nr:P-loop containing nucleoside triphosphate hydrolase protein [Nadsonia fulvescens var. elongata DSM 6958]
MGILEKIQSIQEELARTQKNKATEYHIGLLKGKLARYRQQLLEPAPGSSSSPGQGFEVQKSGDARVALIGFPSVGKSSLLSKITKTKSEIANYAFTTLTSVPGVLEKNGAEIQILDLPGIIQGASEGKGRGRQVVSTAKTADLVLMILDATKPDDQRQILERELEAVGIRLNKEPPNIHFKVKTTGGVKYNALTPAKYLEEKLVVNILRDYKIHNADVLVRDENVTVEDFIDVINASHRSYIKCLYCYNKIDAVSLEEVDRIARQPNSTVISVSEDLGIEDLVDRIWDDLDMLRIYTKKKGFAPDFVGPTVVRKSKNSIEDVCDMIHREFKNHFKYALVWGVSAKHSPQKCGLSHRVCDEDVVSIVTK